MAKKFKEIAQPCRNLPSPQGLPRAATAQSLQIALDYWLCSASRSSKLSAHWSYLNPCLRFAKRKNAYP